MNAHLLVITFDRDGYRAESRWCRIQWPAGGRSIPTLTQCFFKATSETPISAAAWTSGFCKTSLRSTALVGHVGSDN